MAESVRGAAGLQARFKAMASPVTGEKILRDWQTRTIQLAKVAAPKRSGNLKRTIHAGTLGKSSATVEASAGYAAFVEFGTRPHIIRPVRARVLAWGGARRLTGTLRSGAKPTAFARWVKHPGTEPRPFLYPSALQALKETKAAEDIITAWNSGA